MSYPNVPTEFKTQPGSTAPPPYQPQQLVPQPHPLYPSAPQGYSHPSQINVATPSMAPAHTAQHHTNVGKATGKAGAYGGSELGSLIGGKVGPPIIGGIVGNIVGEKYGEKAIHKTGLDDKVTEAGDKLAGVIGRRNVDKLGDMTMTAFGYSDSEVCICCPCLPASQVLLFITVPFFFFNWYKLGVGVDYDRSCSTKPPNDTSYYYNTTDNVTDIYPCEYGFHYLVASSAVWICFLPFWISALFGNCWRQCCCCCCDPIVLCGTIIDFVKRCCCEVGKFNCCEFIWYSQCAFHLIWAATGLVWLAGLPVKGNPYDQIEVPGWEVPKTVWETVLASVIMDFILAGSEVFHRVKLHYTRNNPDNQEAVEEGQMLKNGGGSQQQQSGGGQQYQYQQPGGVPQYQYHQQQSGSVQHQL